jgi:hypothetical protein
MPYDYYDYFIKQRQNEKFIETTELVRQNLWSETINFKQSQRWINTEDKILIELYETLRYN